MQTHQVRHYNNMFPKDYFHKPRLCLITDRKMANLIDAVKQAVDAGVDIVQLREKDLPSKEYFELARQTKIICEKRSVILIINDRVDIALAVDADGVHLGWQSLPFHIVRHLLGKEKIIGVSTHSKEDAILAQEKGADYITVGATLAVAQKGQAQGLPLQRCNDILEIKKHVSIPIFAVGGINENNACEIIETGANGIAVISAILQAENIYETTKRLAGCLNNRRL